MAAVRRLLLLPLFLLPLSFRPRPSLSQPEADALLKFKESLNITKGDLNSWRPGTLPCKDKWWGVYCGNGAAVSGIHITRLGLSGTIDVRSLGALKELRTIRLDNNSLSGPIPSFNQLVHLRGLLLSNNNFSGEILYDFFAAMEDLRKLFLDNNMFTGPIPESIMQLPLLEELNLQNNQFSGRIPDIKEGSHLKNLNMSNNRLEGPIPPGLSKFDAKAFQGNGQLCGPPLKTCPALQEDPGPPRSGQEKAGYSKMVLGISLVTLLIFLLLAVIISARRRRRPDFRMLDKEHLSDSEVNVEVPVPESARKPAEPRKKRDGESKKGSSHQGKGGIGDLVMVNEQKVPFGLPDLMKAAAEVLGNGSLGSAYKAVMANGLAVVVKRIRDMNRLGKEAFDVEMRRIGRLQHPNILTPLAYHYRKEEKLLVSEYMPKSSLLYVLHGDRGVFHSELTWPMRLKIIQGVARGMDFLHRQFSSYDLPHGNLKSSNVLLNESYDPLISDFAFLPLVNWDNATQAFFAFKTPEYTRYQRVSPKSDIYCLGIVILEILTGKFPSQYLSNGKGGTDIVQWVQSAVAEQNEEELIDPEIASNTDSLDHMIQLIRIGDICIRSDPNERPDMREAAKMIEEVRT